MCWMDSLILSLIHILFQKLSMNVDDVFLMLDAKTYQADYISPNVEKLLGITVEQIRKDSSILAKLHMAEQGDTEKNYLEGIQVHEQKEGDFEYVHLKTGEKRWFHNIAMCCEINGKKKFILVMSDRTADWKMNQALSEACLLYTSPCTCNCSLLRNE